MRARRCRDTPTRESRQAAAHPAHTQPLTSSLPCPQPRATAPMSEEAHHPQHRGREGNRGQRRKKVKIRGQPAWAGRDRPQLMIRLMISALVLIGEGKVHGQQPIGSPTGCYPAASAARVPTAATSWELGSGGRFQGRGHSARWPICPQTAKMLGNTLSSPPDSGEAPRIAGGLLLASGLTPGPPRESCPGRTPTPKASVHISAVASIDRDTPCHQLCHVALYWGWGPEDESDPPRSPPLCLGART